MPPTCVITRSPRVFPPPQRVGSSVLTRCFRGAVSRPVGKITANFIEFLEPPPSPTGLLKTKPVGEGAAGEGAAVLLQALQGVLRLTSWGPTGSWLVSLSPV